MTLRVGRGHSWMNGETKETRFRFPLESVNSFSMVYTWPYEISRKIPHQLIWTNNHTWSHSPEFRVARRSLALSARADYLQSVIRFIQFKWGEEINSKAYTPSILRWCVAVQGKSGLEWDVKISTQSKPREMCMRKVDMVIAGSQCLQDEVGWKEGVHSLEMSTDDTV